MKTLYKIAAIIFAAAMISACGKQSIPEQLEAFVDDAELKCDKYSKDDWAKSNEEFQKLADSYISSDKQFTDDENQMALRSIGRYHALLIKHGVRESADFVRNLSRSLPSYINGITNGINELGAKLDSIDINKSIEDLGTAIEGLFKNQNE